MTLAIVAEILAVAGIVLLLGFTNQDLTKDILTITSSKMNMKKKAIALRSGKKNKSIGQKIRYLHDSLEAMGKGGHFAVVCTSSIILFAAGAVVASLINNYFLIPAFGLSFASIPFVYVKNMMQKYENHIAEELETTLSIITTSYVRCDDIIEAVKENVDFLKPPLREHFLAFINDASYVTTTEQAIENLKSKVDNEIYWEWCEALLQCQSDRVLKDTLQPIVSRLTDVRVVNGEIAAMVASCKMEYFTMAAMLVGSIPLLYTLNKDWYDTLMHTIPGKATLGVCGLVIFFTYLLLLKFTKPIEYKG